MDHDKLPPLWEVEGERPLEAGEVSDPTLAALSGGTVRNRRCVVRFRAPNKADALRLASCYGILAKEEDVRPVQDFEAATILLQDASEWARHYSTVRMTVTTFLISLSAAILTFRVGSPEFMRLSIAVWLVAVAFFVLFTIPEWRALDRAEENRTIIRGGSYQKKTWRGRWKDDWGLHALIVLSALFAAGCWSSASGKFGRHDDPMPVRVVEMAPQTQTPP